MKIHIINDQLCYRSEPYNSDTQTYQFFARIRSDGTTSAVDTKYLEFEAAFLRKYAEGQMWSLTVEFNLKQIDSCTESGLGKGDIVLRGEILKQVHQILYRGNQKIALPLALHLNGVQRGVTISTFCIEGFTPLNEANGALNMTCYKVSNVVAPLSPSHFLESPYDLRSISGIQVNGKDFMTAENVRGKMDGLELNRGILEDQCFTDFELVSEDGTVVKCHKAFLCAQSPVFKNMLQGDFAEAKNNKMELRHLTTRSINALLGFIYCRDVEEAMTYCDVALELLKAADMYDIPSLWTAMTRILMEKSEIWYNVEVALGLFEFLRNCERHGEDEREGLMQKMIRILASKTDEELTHSSLYNELFPTEMAREILKRSFKLLDSKEGANRNLNLTAAFSVPRSGHC